MFAKILEFFLVNLPKIILFYYDVVQMTVDIVNLIVRMLILFPGSVLESNQDIDSWFSTKDLEPSMTSLLLLLNIS